MEPYVDNNENRRLREQIATLRGLLASLSRDADHNQAVLQRFQERELALLGASDLVELLERLTRGMRRSFGIDSLKLKLLDPFRVIHDLLDTQRDDLGSLMHDVELCDDVAATRRQFADLAEPWLGRWIDRLHEPVFGWRVGGSVALLPLQHTEGLAGYLCLGSRDANRFESGQATDFLAHLASTAAVCLENAVNRERLRLAGLTDSLTGLYNRRHLQHRLAQEVTRAQRYGQALSCLFVDADRFKRINDEHGHAVGDQVLVAIGQRLRARLRSSDLATRYGGEEFAVLLPETDLPSAVVLAEQIRATIASGRIAIDEHLTIEITVSIGVSELAFSERQENAGERMLRAADDALYRAKAAGRNCVCSAE